MIEAICSACGTLNRVSEASVPAGARFVTCADCKSRVAIPIPTAPTGPANIPSAIPKLLPVTAPPVARRHAGTELADLPAPKRPSTLGPQPPPTTARPTRDIRPTGRSGTAAALDAELPAPKATRASGSIPLPPLDPQDLLVGAAVALDANDGGIDLPAPKKTGQRPAPEPPRDTITDLPAPKAGRSLADLPAPKVVRPRPAGPEVVKARESGATAPHLIPDLPAPQKGPTIPDLPAPRMTDVQPKRGDNAELPTVKGLFDDLPPPRSSPFGAQPHVPADVPAPRGLFDDLPPPARDPQIDLPAPKGLFDDLPPPRPNPSDAQPDPPAPEGFFDSIPQVRSNPSGGRPEAPAPKGYFDNLPALPTTPRPEAPAPKGYFDNIPALPIKKPGGESPQGFFDDLPAPGQPGQTQRPGPAALDRGPADAELHLDAEPELALALDRGPADAELHLEAGPELALIESPGAGPRAIGDLAASATPFPPLRFETPGRARDEAAAARTRARRTKLVLGGLLATALGVGGFEIYQRHAAAQERAAAIAEQLGIARTSYAANDPRHWQRAAIAARHVIELDAKNPEALGIGAESLFASALADGTGAAAKIGQARAMLDTANAAGLSNLALARARALSALVAQAPEAAITQLQPLVTQAPKNGALALYLGWALAARGDAAAAIGAYDTAASDPAVALDALYGRGNAKLALADLAGARADFSAVLARAKDHIGAQVGLATAKPPAAAQQQEADLVAILARKDLASADPRVVAQAWTRAGEAALRDGRQAVARERFHKALGVVPQDLAATTGLAEAALRDGKVAVAAELTAAALAAAKYNVPTQLVQSEIEIKQHNLPLAAQRLAALAGHVTPLAPLEQARLHLLEGELLEAQGKDDEALEAYAVGAKVARDLDLAPMLAAVKKLGAMATAAGDAGNRKRADELRARATQLLGELAEHAEHDPQLAMAIGLAFLQQGEPDKAEPWLHRAVDARPEDAEPRFQLGRALVSSGRPDEALEVFTAARGLDPARAEIGVELARTYEALGRDAEAGAVYATLLAGKEPSLPLRARAGRFFARTGALDKAGEQGAKIVEADPGNPAGLYLKGEGLLAAGNPLEAKQALQRAVELDRDPQYLDALGRAAEALARGGDRALQDLALRSYLAAAEADPTLSSALAGQGRLYVARHEAAKAVAPLLAAARLDPRNAEVMVLIGAAYQELQQTPTALRWLEAATKLSPLPDAFWRIGQIHRDANRGRKAAGALGQATRLAAASEQRTGTTIPWLTEALYLQGRVNLDLHNVAVARDAWVLYVGRNPPASAQLTEVTQLLATALRR